MSGYFYFRSERGFLSCKERELIICLRSEITINWGIVPWKILQFAISAYFFWWRYNKLIIKCLSKVLPAGQKNTILITGHTHQPVFTYLSHLERLYRDLSIARRSGDEEAVSRLENEVNLRRIMDATIADFSAILPGYFNCGCCCFADGDITGIEISGGKIQLVNLKYEENNSKRVTLEEIELEKLASNWGAPLGKFSLDISSRLQSSIRRVELLNHYQQNIISGLSPWFCECLNELHSTVWTIPDIVVLFYRYSMKHTVSRFDFHNVQLLL